MTYPWSHLDYWKSGEWQVVQEKLDELKAKRITICPIRANLFSALSAVKFDSVRVCLIGQDPYPVRTNATGIAFSIPPTEKRYPPTLKNIFEEYRTDLHYPDPPNGDLTPWVKQGVLLWNAYPSCEEGTPGSQHWDEWTYLTKEIVEKLDARPEPLVFVLLGSIARDYERFIHNWPCFTTSHPSALGYNKGFKGSRIFSTTNAMLASVGLKSIDWRLDNGQKNSGSEDN